MADHGVTMWHNFTPILRDRLHWLRAPQRIQSKVALLVYTALNSLSHDYISSYCQSSSTIQRRSTLRSVDEGVLIAPSSANDHLLLPDLICGTICQTMFDDRHRTTSLREGLKHFCLISLLETNLISSAFAFGLSYDTTLYKYFRD